MRSNKMTPKAFLFNMAEAATEAAAARKDPEKRRRYRRSGYYAIVYSVLAALCAPALLLVFVLNDVGAWVILLALFVFPFALGFGAFGTLLMLLNAAVNAVVQLTVNRSALSWIALAVFLAAVAGIAVFLAFFLQRLPL